MPATCKVDIFSEIRRICDFPYELCVIDKTIDELEKIAAEQGGKTKAAVKLALTLIREKGIFVIKTEKNKNADDIITEIAQGDDVVATQDKELRHRLREKRVRLIVLRQKQYLQLQEEA